jgi:hypothetical protein
MVRPGAPASEPVTSRGSLGNLWAEFNDPGPAGDALVFLKKYADGTVPGCMGLVFLAAGIGMMVLFSRVATGSDKKTWLPILFGFVFAAAGFGVLNLGIRTILRKSGSRR